MDSERTKADKVQTIRVNRSSISQCVGLLRISANSKVQEMLDADILEETNSPWNSPCLLINRDVRNGFFKFGSVSVRF